MIVRLDRAIIDTACARTVLDHLRGRVVAATFADFVTRHSVTATGGLSFVMNPDAMVWHNRSAWDLMHTLRDRNPDIRFEAEAEAEEVRILAHPEREPSRPEVGADRWTAPLPPFDHQPGWPCIADVFCAQSASVHNALRLPTIKKGSAEDLLRWADIVLLPDDPTDPSAMDVDDPDGGPRRPNRRRSGGGGVSRSRSSASAAAQVSAPKRRRGIRRWAISVDATHTDPSAAENPSASVGADGRSSCTTGTGGGGGGGAAGAAAPPTILMQLLEWIMRSLHHVSALDTESASADNAGTMPPPPASGEPWTAWSALSADDLVHLAVGGPAPPVMLHSLVRHTVRIVRECTAQTTRNEELQKYYNAVVWYLKPRSVVLAYLRHLLAPSLLDAPVCGIPRIQQMALQYDEKLREFYVSTEGSNLLGLYTARNGLAVDRRRCLTTNIFELHGMLGLEAVSYLFSNGVLASSLGVNNASVRLLVDHLASRGNWRGVNRSSIIVPHAVLASATIENPVKHFQQAAFTATRDPLDGSSANVMTGCPITFGTNGFGLLMDTDSIQSPAF